MSASASFIWKMISMSCILTLKPDSAADPGNVGGALGIGACARHFYSKGKNHVRIFEPNQQPVGKRLKKNTENLRRSLTSPVLDSRFSTLDSPQSRISILNLDSRLSALDSRFLILDFRFSILDFLFSILDSRFFVLGPLSSILDYRFSILDRSSVLDPRFSILDSRLSILDPRFLTLSRFSILSSRSSILDSRLSILDSRFSMLDSRFSILDSRFSILDSRLSILDSRCSILRSRFSIFGSRFSILGWCLGAVAGSFGRHYPLSGLPPKEKCQAVREIIFPGSLSGWCWLVGALGLSCVSFLWVAPAINLRGVRCLSLCFGGLLLGSLPGLRCHCMIS